MTDSKGSATKMRKRIPTDAKILRTISLYVKARSDDGRSSFGNKEFFEIHDRLIDHLRDIKRLERRPEPPLEMLERWVEEYRE